jgi:hypothetical protein
MAEDSGFWIDWKETVFGRRQAETPPPECGGDGHDVTVLEERVWTKFRGGRGHCSNVSEARRTGNPGDFRFDLSARMVNKADEPCVTVGRENWVREA